MFSQSGWAVLLFLLALAPRLPGLRLFLTSDEQTNLYWAGSQFVEGLLSGDLSLTYWHFYPGVTMSWVETVGLAGAWALERLAGVTTATLAQFVRRPILDLILAARLPYALLTAASVAGFYLLARRLLGHRTALLGALFIAFDPFYLAHSRVAHGDAPVTIFMGLSALAFFIYLQTETSGKTSRRWLILSALMGALAALTKAPGQFMAPFIILVGVGDWLLSSWRARRPDWRLARRWLVDLVLWGVFAAIIFVALWPAAWIDPAETLVRMLDETFGKVEEGHLVFFMGQPTLNPGPWFYPYVIPFRLTPVSLVAMLASGLIVLGKMWKLARKGDEKSNSSNRDAAAALFWFFVFSLLLFGNLSPKKQDRYLLPLFPFLDLLAAFAIVLVSESASRWAGKRASTLSIIRNTIPAILLVAHALPTITAYPYYLAYFNPMMGGLPQAVETTLVGWGEGMEQAAYYLDKKSEAKSLYVAATPSQTLLPYFVGTGENFYTNDVALRADYVVLYIAQVQRLAPSPEIVRHFRAMAPEHTVYVRGVPYAWIYPGPKLITNDVPAGATPTNIGFGDQLRLAGYETSNQPVGQSQIILYWHALAAMDSNYTVSVRLLAPEGAGYPKGTMYPEGTILAQQDSWPAGGLLPTSQWRQGDYVRDEHILDLPRDVPPGDYAVQVVVYDSISGVALSEPLTVTTLSPEVTSP